MTNTNTTPTGVGRKPTRNRLHKACCEPLNAINWALDSGCCEGAERAFLADWRCGDFGEWGDYVEWVRRTVAALQSGEQP